ncbi:RB1-inducible coiled-coil protein 1-like [Pieris rapae]|uniref:RB1-inducible coiled-coil protein 1-like n=1 Tax=Pieris rapae TaxID=64459 RepID=UPI001E281713|nr:RB1-inducible coiled-coil protein 1-like [Pieris rapae]
MVYYYTSNNVKMLRNMIIDYGASTEISPYEYMKTYISKCPENTEDAKLSWIAEAFLGIQKHGEFLKEIASYMSEELSEEDQDYFIIVFHAITFQITPTDMSYLYKCLFNLSKPLLSTFTNFLSNNEVLTYVSQVAQNTYDTNFITNKIISPLFSWQPYISEMAHNYAEYLKKIERRKIKPLTIPIQPNVLRRKNHSDLGPLRVPSPVPDTPPNSIQKKRHKMLPKSVIDKKLKNMHEKNQINATQLLHVVKTNNSNFAKGRSENYYKKLSDIRNEMDNEYKKTKLNVGKRAFSLPNTAPTIKETTATVKRINTRIQKSQSEEVKWLEDLITNFRDVNKIEQMKDYDRQEKERERLLSIEKKHLMGQISHEEALIAKRKCKEENRKKYEEFLREKQNWDEEIENWKKREMEKNRKQVEKLSLLELNLMEAKNNATLKKKETADQVKKENEAILAQAMEAKQEELEKRIRVIKEIKMLAEIAKKAKVPKIIDLTETSGLGLLCEMSMAELQERLSNMKICFCEELENKKKIIKQEHLAAKNKLKETKESIKSYMNERETLRKEKKSSNNIQVNSTTSKEIGELKKILDEKRKLRVQLTV